MVGGQFRVLVLKYFEEKKYLYPWFWKVLVFKYFCTVLDPNHVILYVLKYMQVKIWSEFVRGCRQQGGGGGVAECSFCEGQLSVKK